MRRNVWGINNNNTMKLTEKQLEMIIATYERLDSATDAAEKAGCLCVDGPLHEAIWDRFECVIALFDPHEWIPWYIHENDMGKNALEAEIGSRIIKVKSIKDLLKVINA